MAERRMFAKSIIDSDAFLDMPLSAQALYFHLGMRADDDGFVNSPRRIMRLINCSDDDMKLLIAKNFVIIFDNGIVVIKHWRIHNYIRSDRYKPSAYTEEKSMLAVKKNGSYTLADTVGIPSDIPTGDVGKVRIGKDSIGKVRSDKERIEEESLDNCCSSGVVDFMELLTLEEIEYLKTVYENVYELIDEAGADATKKHKKIGEPFAYLVGYATNKGWVER